MRLQLLLPKVDPKEMNEPAECVYTDCGSKQIKMHQQVEKALRDTMYSHVEVYRYRCLKCGRTFRVYPKGVSQGQISDRVKGLAVMLYLLGLSYGAVSLALERMARASLKNGSLQHGTGCCPTHPRYETGAGLWRSENQSSRRGFDECEMCREVVASGERGAMPSPDYP